MVFPKYGHVSTNLNSEFWFNQAETARPLALEFEVPQGCNFCKSHTACEFPVKTQLEYQILHTFL